MKKEEVKDLDLIHVKRRYFCCCLPTRLGTLALSLILTGVSILADITLITALQDGDLDGLGQFIIVACLIWSIICGIISLFGLAGALFKRRLLVAWFYDLLWVLIWVTFVVGVFTVAVDCRTSNKVRLINACTAQSTSTLSWQLMVGYCKTSVSIKLVAGSLLWAVALLLELWLAMIVSSYLEQLADEEAAELGFDLEEVSAPFLVRGGDGENLTAGFVEQGAQEAASAQSWWKRFRAAVRDRHKAFDEMRAPRTAYGDEISDEESEKL